MKMVDMKRGPESPVAVPAMNPLEGYSGGLCLYLCEEDIKKLGLEELPEPGAMIQFQAVAVVRSKSEHESLGMGESRHMELQIVQLGMKPGKKKKETSTKDLAGKLYAGHVDDQEY